MHELSNIQSLHFFPGIDGLIENGATQKFKILNRNIIISLKAGYAIREGLKLFSGMINLKGRYNGTFENRSYNVTNLPLLKK